MRKIIKIITIALIINLFSISLSRAEAEFKTVNGKLYVRDTSDVTTYSVANDVSLGFTEAFSIDKKTRDEASGIKKVGLEVANGASQGVGTAVGSVINGVWGFVKSGWEFGSDVVSGENVGDAFSNAVDTFTDQVAGDTKKAREYHESCSSDAVDKCAPYCKYKTVENCFLCPIFSAMFNTVNLVTAQAIIAYSASVAKVVVFAFAIWLALQVLRFVASIETRDLKDLIQAIITQGFIVMLVVIILDTGVSSFFNTFVTPIYLTGQNAAQVVFTHTETKMATEQMSGIKEIKNGFSPEIGRSIIKTMTTIENEVIKFRTLGSSVMCYSFTKAARVWAFFPNMTYLITGLALWVFATLLIVVLPFLMIDSVFQLGVVGALMPPALGAAAFKYTRSKYTKPVWETFLNSMFAFVFISMVILLLLGVLRQTVTFGMGHVSGSLEEASQAEAVANGEKPEILAETNVTTSVSSSEMPDFNSVVEYTKKKEGLGKKKDGIYIDSTGNPTCGYGHLLFMAYTGGGKGANHEKRFNAWYNEKIKNIPFIDVKTNRPATEERKRTIFKKLYDTCKDRAGSKCVRGDENIVNGELRVDDGTINEALRADVQQHYNATKKKCGNSGGVIDECTVWSSYNLGNAECRFHGDLCEKALTSKGLNRSYLGSATSGVTTSSSGGSVPMDTTQFDSMFTPSGEAYTFFESMLSTFHWRSLHFIRLIFVFILGWSVMKMAKEFAEEMAKSISNTAIGSSIGTMAASSAKGMAVKAGKPIAQAAERETGKFVRWGGRKIGNKISGAWAAYKISRSKKKMQGSADGTYVDKKGYKHKMSEDSKTEIITREKTLSTQVHQEANGNIRTVNKKEKIERFKSKEMTIETKKITEVTIIKDKDGKEISKDEKIISVEEKVTFHGISDRDLVGRDGKVNQKLINKLMEGKTSEEKQRIQRAVMKRIHEQRFSKGVREQKLKGVPELVNERTVREGNEEIREITYKMVTAKGEIVFETTRFRQSGYVETHQDIITQDGKYKRLSSDGLRNREIAGKLKNMDGIADAKDYNQIGQIIASKSEGSSTLRFSYSKYARHLINHGVDPRDIGFDEEGNQLGMMSWNAAVGKGNLFEGFIEGKGYEFEKAKIATDIII